MKFDIFYCGEAPDSVHCGFGVSKEPGIPILFHIDRMLRRESVNYSFLTYFFVSYSAGTPTQSQEETFSEISLSDRTQKKKRSISSFLITLRTVPFN